MVGDLETSWLPSRARPADHETGSKGRRAVDDLARPRRNRIVNISCARNIAQDMLPIVTNESSPDHPATPDPRALRALAHPLRWQLIDLIGSETTVTATRCAEVLGQTVANCSYH